MPLNEQLGKLVRSEPPFEFIIIITWDRILYCVDCIRYLLVFNHWFSRGRFS